MKKISFKLVGAYVACLLTQGIGVAAHAATVDANEQLIHRGEYLAQVGDCIACHTAKSNGAKPFAGGLPIASPIGTIYSTNITPDVATGIGSYTYANFEQAVRHGVAKDGDSLYPAMPYPSYARVNDDDMHALYAYFMHGVAPVSQQNRPEDIPWPLSMRWPLALWRWTFGPQVVAFAPPPGTDAETARGAYLVEGLGHCSACHTPRGVGMEEKALTAADGSAFLSGGGLIDLWTAPSLRGEAATGLGQWSEADIKTFLKTGVNDHTAAFGGMTDVVQNSTQYMTDADLSAMAHYLKSLQAAQVETPLADDASVSHAVHAGDLSALGSDTYVNSCAACHRTNGQGYKQVFPTLAKNPVVNGRDPTSLIHIVLAGSATASTAGAPAQFTMPPYGWRLSDTEVANVVTFVRSSWGNRGAPVTAAQVAKVRSQIPVAELGSAPQR